MAGSRRHHLRHGLRMRSPCARSPARTARQRRRYSAEAALRAGASSTGLVGTRRFPAERCGIGLRPDHGDNARVDRPSGSAGFSARGGSQDRRDGGFFPRAGTWSCRKRSASMLRLSPTLVEIIWISTVTSSPTSRPRPRCSPGADQTRGDQCRRSAWSRAGAAHRSALGQWDSAR